MVHTFTLLFEEVETGDDMGRIRRAIRRAGGTITDERVSYQAEMATVRVEAPVTREHFIRLLPENVALADTD